MCLTERAIPSWSYWSNLVVMLWVNQLLWNIARCRYKTPSSASKIPDRLPEKRFMVTSEYNYQPFQLSELQAAAFTYCRMWGEFDTEIQVTARREKKQKPIKVKHFVKMAQDNAMTESQKVSLEFEASKATLDYTGGSKKCDFRTVQTRTLSGQPSGELKEVSPVWVSCPPLRWLPPFPGNSGHSPSTHTHTQTQKAAVGPQTPSPHTLSLSHTHIPLCYCFSLSLPTPYNNNLLYFPIWPRFLLSHKLRKENRKTNFLLLIFIYDVSLISTFSHISGLFAGQSLFSSGVPVDQIF